MKTPFRPQPQWYYDSDTTDEQRVRWAMQERCRRQASRQQTAYARRVENKAQRAARRMEANPASVDVEEYR